MVNDVSVECIAVLRFCCYTLADPMKILLNTVIVFSLGFFRGKRSQTFAPAFQGVSSKQFYLGYTLQNETLIDEKVRIWL
jgi:hypothetical protein